MKKGICMILLAALLALSACEKLPEAAYTPEPITTAETQGAKPVPTPGGYIKPEDRVYVPGPDMAQEAEAMKQRMNEAMVLPEPPPGRGWNRAGYYVFTDRDSITLEGKTYPVIWFSAEGDGAGNEFADVIFTDDPELVEVLQRNRAYFWGLWEEQLEDLRYKLTLDLAHDASFFPNDKLTLCYTREAGDYWIFYSGTGLTFFDCGFTDQDQEVYLYSDELRDYTRYYSRDSIEGVNRFSTKAPQ